jgi:hypothetical protein
MAEQKDNLDPETRMEVNRALRVVRRARGEPTGLPFDDLLDNEASDIAELTHDLGVDLCETEIEIKTVEVFKVGEKYFDRYEDAQRYRGELDFRAWYDVHPDGLFPVTGEDLVDWLRENRTRVLTLLLPAYPGGQCESFR